ncbi:MAG: hypothetical protein ACRDQZ_17120 [Mycobacteriales bacterium]
MQAEGLEPRESAELVDPDQSLLGYVMEGRVSEQVALDYASSPHDFKLMLSAGGQRASGIEQLASSPPAA